MTECVTVSTEENTALAPATAFALVTAPTTTTTIAGVVAVVVVGVGGGCVITGAVDIVSLSLLLPQCTGW